MYKRGIALLLVVLLLVAVFPTSVSAATDEEKKQIRKDISWDYYSALSSTGKSSLGGYCGLMAGWQLYFMGINKGVHGYNGNLQFDYYKDKEETTGGYKIKAYSAEEYTLKEALNAISDNGKRDVYNLLAGFQWTNTTEGAKYGHVVVVYAILDGMVYFTEGFETYLGAPVGSAVVVSIDRFVDYYDDWARFEGIILFGHKDYVKNCREYPGNLFVQAVTEVPVYSTPCLPEDGEVESKLLRTAVSGERLLATGLYENTLNQFYYQIEDDGSVCYIPAETVQPLLELEKESSYLLDGQVETGFTVPESRTIPDGWVWENGTWYYFDHGQPRTGWLCYDGVDYYLQEDGSVATGWHQINGQDRYFSNTGAMRTGWMQMEQGQCYLMSNGAKATGWRTVDGTRYYFDKNGILQTDGWLTLQSQTYYLFPNGNVATGWVDLEDGHFCFGNDGRLLAQSVQSENGVFIRTINEVTGNTMTCCTKTARTATSNNG